MVLISTIGLNRVEGTRKCLERVFTHGKDFHLVLTNNGSKDGTAKVFDEIAAKHKNVTVFHNATNEGFQEPHARAFGIAAKMGAKYFLCLNDDLLVSERFIETLIEPMERDATVAITGPEGGCECLNHQFHGEAASGRAPDYCEGSLMMVRVEAIQRLRNNLWCPGLRGIYGEDSSLSLFVREKGYQIAKVRIQAQHARSSTVNSEPEIKAYCNDCQEHNHLLNQHRWDYYLKHHRFDLPIVLKRKYAIGDVVLMTPVIKAIAKARPLSPILVETDYPELFLNNPHVYHADKKIEAPTPRLCVDFNDTYERMPMTHIVNAYHSAAKEVIAGLGEVDLQTELFPSSADQSWADKQGSGKIALLAVDSTTWPGKNWPMDRMQKVAQSLFGDGWTVIAVGSKSKIPSGWPKVVNLVGQTTLMQLAALCRRASLMVTPDTSSLHIAQAVGCPTVGLFGVTSSRFIATQGSKFIAVESDSSIPNSGIRHRVTGKTFLEEGEETMKSITVEHVLEAVKKLEV